MLRQFDNFSTWRQDSITIQPHEVATVNFKDTTPNIFVIQNSNTAMLKIGISNIPRDDSYEFKVDYNTTETVGRPFGSNNLYILNDSSIEVKVTVFSIQKEFDPTILKNMNVSLNGYTIESNSEISGVMEGVTLPVSDTNTNSLYESFMTFMGRGGNTVTMNAVRTLLNKIADNTANIELNADTVNVTNEYDDTEIKNKVISIDSKMSSLTGGLCEFVGYGPGRTLVKAEELKNKLIDIETALAKLDTLSEKIESVSTKARDIEKSILFKGYGIKFPTYKNNVVEYSYTPKGAVGLNFDYIYNDSESPITVYIEQVDIQGSATVTNKQEVFTIMPHEKVENIEFLTLDETMTITIEGIQPIFRLKQTIYTDSLFNV